MRSNRRTRRALAGAFFSLPMLAGAATPQVVGDEACERYAVDIAAFATCVDGKVVRPETDARVSAGASRTAAAGAARPAAIALPPRTAGTPSPVARSETTRAPSQSR